MEKENKALIRKFIERIWNQNFYEDIAQYLSSDYIDHSLPANFPTDRFGLQRWIEATSNSFKHKTVIDEIVAENEKIMIKIKMDMTHIGVWRGIEPTRAVVTAVGYRFYKLKDFKITSHWALIDGNAIENQLKSMRTGCKLQE